MLPTWWLEQDGQKRNQHLPTVQNLLPVQFVSSSSSSNRSPHHLSQRHVSPTNVNHRLVLWILKGEEVRLTLELICLHKRLHDCLNVCYFYSHCEVQVNRLDIGVIVVRNVFCYAAVRCEFSSFCKCTSKCLMEQRNVKCKKTRWILIPLALFMLLLF